jgi:hypothetical protein
MDRVNPLPNGVLATFSVMAVGPIGPPKLDDISKEKTILMTSLRINRTSGVRKEELSTCPHPLPLNRMYKSLCTSKKNHTPSGGGGNRVT